MTHAAPRIVNSVSCVTRINHEIHFSMNPGVANFTRGYLKDISFIELTRALIST